MKQVFGVLNEMVRDGALEDYAVAGAIGAMFYVEPFSTQDVLVMTPEDRIVGELPGIDYLKARGYAEFRNEGIVIEDQFSFYRRLATLSVKLTSMRTSQTSRRFQFESLWQNTWLL